MTLETGKGEHGGFGKYEQNPFLIAIEVILHRETVT